MELGTAPLFDLPAPLGVEAAEPVAPEAEPVPLTRSQVLLAEIRQDEQVIRDREIAKICHIAEWALEHVVDDEADAATLTERGLDTGLPLAGPGAPLISDFAVMELNALLGRSLDSGRNYVGQVLELSHRLPQLWQRTLDGQVPVWKALRIADLTRSLCDEAAAYVDRQLAISAQGCTWPQVDRLVEEALVRFDPEAAEERRRQAHEHRHVNTGLDAVGFNGTANLSATLDAADALDLENAIARRAKLLGQLGDEDNLDVRRSKALGEIAREDLMLDLHVVDAETGEITRTVPGRKTELILHLNPDEMTVGRFGNTKTPISPEQIKTWLGLSGTTVLVRPVVDLAGHQPVDSYEIPDRLRRQVTERDHHCVFPHCTVSAGSTVRPGRCDLDHVEPHTDGGATCPCNLAPLCRGHHRMKTAGRAAYRMLHPGTYVWTLDSGTYLVDPTGTHRLTGTRPPDH
ncbi:DUF222 domain-containing protein [Nocardioides silvaticus]|uniref:DUF222 domain-containing protein n=1 Tax=Nocardioides silvaticus TaxID=2201891 RepID=A0A316TQU2_9ACTN|nr:HNH endonuclease signature motif containing protein [Nocardioides silvaticus]PWN04602.1 DUF222 domain-containing protein [Nocardioides silvaticus]